MTDERFAVRPEVALGLFESLPVLTVITAETAAGEQVIEDCNDRFAARLGRSRADLIGAPLRSLYAPAPAATHQDSDVEPEGSVRFDGRGSTERPHHRRGDAAVERDLVRADGRLVHTVAESVPRGDADGHVHFHVDITRRKHREKQADVLNRLMRHNVRNDLNLLHGHARKLAAHGDDAVTESASVINRIADRWIGLAEKARTIERLFDDEPAATARIEDVVDDVEARIVREWSSDHIETEIRAARTCCISDRLSVPLIELCENGIKHTEGEAGEVRLSVESGGEPGWVDIHVADDGPGLPEAELEALRAAEETPLRHGDGLGLWLVRFVVRRLGGAISAHSDEHGTLVRLHVPLAAGNDGRGDNGRTPPR
ncbi:MAG: ATP-binding protein [Haloquadratum sp.]